MGQELPGPCRRLLEFQHGVIARRQAARVGISSRSIDNFVRRGRWQPLGWGTYAAFTGEPPRLAVLWAAVLRLGPRAILSHETAAELDGLMDKPAPMIHVTVEGQRHLSAVPGTIVHRSGRLQCSRHPGLSPPRTMIEETVLDLTQAAATFDDAFGWISRGCQRGLTTPTLLRIRMDMRKKVRWRTELWQALHDVDAGVHSPLEFRYVRDVERPHRLPRARRQARAIRQGRRQYRDALYEDFGLCVELDGRVAHSVENRWLDIRRDNANAADGIVTLRYGWSDVTKHPCEVAAEVARVLRLRGWRGRPRACQPGCPAAIP
ncbi:MAG: type IV toxin-antitoxin system AbiEi family antitoxin domain-containing protein [Micromonosporaceae bacterium]